MVMDADEATRIPYPPPAPSNGAAPGGSVADQASVPDCITISSADAARVPSPGTLRALKAQTGRDWDEMMGPDADAADRFQTTIWVRLRKTIPGLRWEQCEDVDLIIEDAGAPLPLAGPTDSSGASPPSVGSGG